MRNSQIRERKTQRQQPKLNSPIRENHALAKKSQSSYKKSHSELEKTLTFFDFATQTRKKLENYNSKIKEMESSTKLQSIEKNNQQQNLNVFYSPKCVYGFFKGNIPARVSESRQSSNRFPNQNHQDSLKYLNREQNHLMLWQNFQKFEKSSRNSTAYIRTNRESVSLCAKGIGQKILQNKLQQADDFRFAFSNKNISSQSQLTEQSTASLLTKSKPCNSLHSERKHYELTPISNSEECFWQEQSDSQPTRQIWENSVIKLKIENSTANSGQDSPQKKTEDWKQVLQQQLKSRESQIVKKSQQQNIQIIQAQPGLMEKPQNYQQTVLNLRKMFQDTPSLKINMLSRHNSSNVLKVEQLRASNGLNIRSMGTKISFNRSDNNSQIRQADQNQKIYSSPHTASAYLSYVNCEG